MQLSLYEQMSECLVGFRAGTMSLSDLIDRIPKLLKRLDDPNQAWKSEFVSYWWTLEQVHSQAIELGESVGMPVDTRTTVDDAIDGMERLVNNALGRY